MNGQNNFGDKNGQFGMGRSNNNNAYLGGYNLDGTSKGGQVNNFKPSWMLGKFDQIHAGQDLSEVVDEGPSAEELIYMEEMDEEYFERFDSRGHKMRLRRAKVDNPLMERLEKSYACVNFDPNSLITQKDLKARATSIVYSKYKQIKREVARKEQQRRLNWFRSIVIAKKFSKQLLIRAKKNLNQKKVEERRKAEQKQLQTSSSGQQNNNQLSAEKDKN